MHIYQSIKEQDIKTTLLITPGDHTTCLKFIQFSPSLQNKLSESNNQTFCRINKKKEISLRQYINIYSVSFQIPLDFDIATGRTRLYNVKQPNLPSLTLQWKAATETYMLKYLFRGGTFLEIAYLFVNIRKRLSGKSLSVRQLKKCSWIISICSVAKKEVRLKNRYLFGS